MIIKLAKNILALLFLGIIVLVIIVSCSSSDDTETTTTSENLVEQAPIEITASALFDAYEQNEVAADKLYKGQNIKITGTVDSISSDFSDSAQVALATSNQFLSVMTKGDDAFNDKAATLSKGQKITMMCKGDGEVISMPMLSKCVIE